MTLQFRSSFVDGDQRSDGHEPLRHLNGIRRLNNVGAVFGVGKRQAKTERSFHIRRFGDCLALAQINVRNLLLIRAVVRQIFPT